MSRCVCWCCLELELFDDCCGALFYFVLCGVSVSKECDFVIYFEFESVDNIALCGCW